MRATVGVEEEFLLADPRTGQALPGAEQVIARCGTLPRGARVQRELRPTQLESSTGVCTTSDEVRDQLVACRQALAAAAGDLVLLATGTPIAAAAPVPPPPTPGRYAEIDDRYGGLVEDYEACGSHVHVGVPDPDTAVAVVNHLARWLPALLALSANSPSDRGRDTGYHSWRMVLQSRFPGSGVAPFFTGHAEYRAAVDTLVSCGALVDPAQTFWLARPSPHFSTVEIRVADTALTVDEAVLQVLLSQALVATACTDLAHGREAAPLSPQVCAAAVWAAARHGMSAWLVDPQREARLPAWHFVESLLDHVQPALDGDIAEVIALLEPLRRSGTGSVRQRAVSGLGIRAGIDVLAVRVASGVPG